MTEQIPFCRVPTKRSPCLTSQCDDDEYEDGRSAGIAAVAAAMLSYPALVAIQLRGACLIQRYLYPVTDDLGKGEAETIQRRRCNHALRAGALEAVLGAAERAPPARVDILQPCFHALTKFTSGDSCHDVVGAIAGRTAVLRAALAALALRGPDVEELQKVVCIFLFNVADAMTSGSAPQPPALGMPHRDLCAALLPLMSSSSTPLRAEAAYAARAVLYHKGNEAKWKEPVGRVLGAELVAALAKAAAEALRSPQAAGTRPGDADLCSGACGVLGVLLCWEETTPENLRRSLLTGAAESKGGPAGAVSSDGRGQQPVSLLSAIAAALRLHGAGADGDVVAGWAIHAAERLVHGAGPGAVLRAAGGAAAAADFAACVERMVVVHPDRSDMKVRGARLVVSLRGAVAAAAASPAAAASQAPE